MDGSGCEKLKVSKAFFNQTRMPIIKKMGFLGGVGKKADKIDAYHLPSILKGKIFG
eukprot:NODE_2543_length_419_cov_33.424324_g2462_i0.p1 GENE.NODE_2543_length_419_cov_33.424324_g2462_i0~~NODE_2543_length_419_cov_33.424324_g2462_i0.p1  ORF type:complete len:56 (+),score=7.11 NODE_2543_length_419_cov_33.424324_g2462_i0:197-364(+)